MSAEEDSWVSRLAAECCYMVKSAYSFFAPSILNEANIGNSEDFVFESIWNSQKTPSKV
ncbi:hypothetical protein A2U01_0060944, partial [Trifolium medium]|nr:hypothetical protein [Trifolium medium]